MDNLTVEQRRKNMQNIRSKGTKVERLVARELRRNKIYFAQNVATLIGKPDFVFRRRKVVVFIDSDFWHGHSTRCVMPKSNCAYWDKKILRNRVRDRKVNKELRAKGWKVVRIWEHDVNKNLNRGLKKIFLAIGRLPQ